MLQSTKITICSKSFCVGKNSVFNQCIKAIVEWVQYLLFQSEMSLSAKIEGTANDMFQFVSTHSARALRGKQLGGSSPAEETLYRGTPLQSKPKDHSMALPLVTGM